MPIEAHTEISAPLGLQPRWLRLKRASDYSGLPQDTLLKLCQQGQIDSALVGWRNTRRPIRVVDRLSIDSYLQREIADYRCAQT
jgi:hypothetical protein